jgi:putative intracellular protease/amidase
MTTDCQSDEHTPGTEARMSEGVEVVHLFVMDTLADWEPGLAVAGINTPAFQLHPGRYAVRTVGPTRDPVRTMGGVTFLPDVALEELDPAGSAMLILPGGSAWDAGEHGDAAEAAEAFLAAGVPVAAICGATAGLARRGVLNGRRHTSNAPDYLAALPGYTGGDGYVDAPAVRDGDLITASGIAPVDFARAIFERLELYAPPVLEAWYALYRHGDASAFHALAAGGEAPA